MTAEVQSVNETAPLEDIVELMERKRIKRVPVLCGGHVVGIITRSNLMQAMVSLAREAAPAAAGRCRHPPSSCWPKSRSRIGRRLPLINVVVRDGVVELWGLIVDERQREALKVAAENTPGVKAVKDHLVWIEPTSGLVIEPKEEAPMQPPPPRRPPVIAAFPRR